MSAESFSDAQIVAAWHANASPWVETVRAGTIESRRRVTDRTIVEAVVAQQPATAVDVGCGEGWLARALTAEGVQVVGVDVVPTLIEAARAAGGGDYRVLSYEALATGALDLRVDAVVCNFSLLGKSSVEGVVRGVPRLLNPGGVLIIQTLHPRTTCGDAPYGDGWRAGSWDGCGEGFKDPAPWYFRTIESWLDLLRESGLRLLEQREPAHPDTGEPASIIFVATPDPV